MGISKRLLPVLMIITACTGGVPAWGIDEPDIEGAWQGTLVFGETKLRVVFVIARDKKGTLTATMDSPDQGVKDIPVDGVRLKGGRLLIEVKAVRGEYSGVYDSGSGSFEGLWTQGGGKLPLQLVKTDRPERVSRPQEPRKPYPYREEEVSFKNDEAGVTLSGTLTIPQGPGPHPAALLISGSGSQNRDEEVLGHKPFLVLADYLTRRGIAVLRYDDRGSGSSTGDADGVTSKDLAGDALAGFRYLKSRREIDGGRAGMIGHSEGGLIAPLAALEEEAAFVVLLAGPGLPGDKILLDQNRKLLEAEGLDGDTIERFLTHLQETYTIIRDERDPETARRKITKTSLQFLQSLPEKTQKTLGLNEKQMREGAAVFTSPWFMFYLTYDPVPALSKLTCPVLALNGDRDMQVDAAQNLRAIGRALDGGNTKNRTVMLPGLNHLFQTASTGHPKEYGSIEETFAPQALQTVGDLIEEVTAR